MKTYIFLFINFILASSLFGEGLMIPKEADYPDDFLKNISSEVIVNIYGNIAETRVLQEFKNEWYDTVSATYSFPLPITARTTRLLYSRGDTMVDAVLKVQQQDVNPGTGEGGTASLVNAYMGKNVIRIKISDIRPQSTQKVEIQYISEVVSANGNYNYQYPFDTKDFVDYPLEYFKFNVNLFSNLDIANYNLEDIDDYSVLIDTDSVLCLNILKNKVYPKKDIDFNFNVINHDITMQFSSSKPDSADGYFSFIIQPKLDDYTSENKSIVFILEASTSLSTNVFDQSRLGIKKALEQLEPTDKFNIVAYNNTFNSFKNNLVSATESNINESKDFLDEVNLSYSNRLDMAVSFALNQLKDEPDSKSILLFSRGYNYIDLNDINESNSNKTGIFSVSIGKDIEKNWLETMCRSNYGFSSFIGENEDIGIKIERLINVISNPIFSELNVDFENITVHSVLPETKSKLYNGRNHIITGKYAIADTSDILIFDTSTNTDTSKLNVIYANEKDNNFTEKLWAKMAIDKLEASILIDGENDTVKNELIELSLKYNMRCRYTAFMATYETNEEPTETSEVTDPIYEDGSEIILIGENIIHNKSGLNLSTYPNPTTDILFLKINIEKIVDQAYIVIYDMSGRILVKLKLDTFEKGNLIAVHLNSLIPDYHGMLYLNVEGKNYRSNITKVIKE